MNPVMPTVSGRTSGDEVSVRAITNSFHAAIKVKIIAVRRQGRASGRVILRSTLNREQPSSIAASSISSGMPEKNPVRIQTQKARLKAAFTRISERYVLTKPRATNSR